MALLLLAAGGSRKVLPAHGADFTLEELQACVGGHIEVKRLGSGWFVCNEDGHRLGLPLNKSATVVYEMTGRRGPVLGDVLLCEEGEVV